MTQLPVACSPAWVLNQLAGNYGEAYDFMKACFADPNQFPPPTPGEIAVVACKEAVIVTARAWRDDYDGYEAELNLCHAIDALADAEHTARVQADERKLAEMRR